MKEKVNINRKKGKRKKERRKENIPNSENVYFSVRLFHKSA